MKRRTRHTLILPGVPILLLLALGGWIFDATLRRNVKADPGVEGNVRTSLLALCEAKP